MRRLSVLCACEESQTVCKAFRALGHHAFSCDLQPCSGGHPEWHIRGDVMQLIDLPWDLIVAHPPCTYLTRCGAVHLYPHKNCAPDPVRLEKGFKGRDFFLRCLNPRLCRHVAVENPFPLKVFNLPPYSQLVEPWEHGHGLSKPICLWLRGLPPLFATSLVNHVPFFRAVRSSSAKTRSKFYSGIAAAMANQWSSYLLSL